MMEKIKGFFKKIIKSFCKDSPREVFDSYLYRQSLLKDGGIIKGDSNEDSGFIIARSEGLIGMITADSILIYEESVKTSYVMLLDDYANNVLDKYDDIPVDVIEMIKIISEIPEIHNYITSLEK